MASEKSESKNIKRLAVFLDGTWNEVDDNTNVWRLRTLLADVSADGSKQCAYYSAGLGTKFGEKFRGGMFGGGIVPAITIAYEWLVANYEPNDEIFIFGFSRGAYTARSLSGLVCKYGLLKRGSPLGVNQMFKRYRRLDNARTLRELHIAQDAKRTDFTFEEAWMLKHAQRVDVKFIGVFDTVGALGVPFPIYRRLKGEAYPFLNTGLRRSNNYAFHALALDEHRKAFGPTLWTNLRAQAATPRTIDKTEQRWFIGAHANVGGGCFDDTLAQLPFKWLERKAMSLGLTFSQDYPLETPCATAPISDSYAEFMYGWYRPMTFWIRHHRKVGEPMIEEGEKVNTINETIDSSVFDRWRSNPKYRPPSLRKWAKLKQIDDPGRITTSVLAYDPTVVVPD